MSSILIGQGSRTTIPRYSEIPIRAARAPGVTDEMWAYFIEHFVGEAADADTRLLGVTQVQCETQYVTVTWYEESHGFGRVQERIAVRPTNFDGSHPGGGSSWPAGVIKEEDREARAADEARRAAEAEAKRCKHTGGVIPHVGVQCKTCDEVMDPDDRAKAMACNSCGHSFLRAPEEPINCTECGKWASKEGDEACPYCEDTEPEWRTATWDECTQCHAAINVA